MKTSFVSYLILLSTLFIFISCEVAEKPLKIEVDVFTPLATKADTTLPEPFLTLIQPVNFGDTLMYIPSVFYKRVDLKQPNSGQITVPVPAISDFQKSINTYTPNDYKNDVEALIEEEAFRMEPILVAKPGKNLIELQVNEEDYDIIWVKDSSLIKSSPKKFASAKAIKEHLAKELQNKNGKTAFRVLIMPPVDGDGAPDPSLDSMKIALYKVLSGKNWKNAPQIAQMLVKRYGKNNAMFQELLEKADKQFALAKNIADSPKDCNFIVLPLIYYSCAAIVADSDINKNIISEREATCKSFAEGKGCTFTTITLPSSFFN